MGAHRKDVAEAQRRALMEYLRECQMTGVEPDIHEAEEWSGYSNREVYRLLADYNNWLQVKWIIGPPPDFEVLTQAEQERIWSERGGRKEE